MACFEFLVFFVSFPGSLLEVSVLTFLELNIPLEGCNVLSAGVRLSIPICRTLDLVI